MPERAFQQIDVFSQRPGDGNPLAGVWTVIWIALTVLGAVGAARGNDWRNPVRAALPWEVLSEGKR